jgi:hypothetical protein
MEFEELDRRFQGMLTKAEAKEFAKSELAKHDGVVKPIEARLDQARAVLTDPSAAFLSAGDKEDIKRRIESLEFQLEQAKKLREQSIVKCGGLIRSVKEWEPKRARWLELRKRSQDIERAKDLASGRVQDMNITHARKW